MWCDVVDVSWCVCVCLCISVYAHAENKRLWPPTTPNLARDNHLPPFTGTHSLPFLPPPCFQTQGNKHRKRKEEREEEEGEIIWYPILSCICTIFLEELWSSVSHSPSLPSFFELNSRSLKTMDFCILFTSSPTFCRILFQVFEDYGFLYSVCHLSYLPSNHVPGQWISASHLSYLSPNLVPGL